MLTVLSKVWDTVSGGVTDRFLERILGPALFFWGVGGLAYAWSRRLGPAEISNRLQDVSLADGVFLILLVAVVLSASNALMGVLQPSILRGLEGYLPGPFLKLLQGRVDSVRRKVASYKEQWKGLAEKYDSHTDEERTRYRWLDRRLSYYPENDYQIKPTRIGNVLAAAESYAWDRYGLASVLIWPRLWLVLDESSRKEVTQARDRLDGSVEFLAWSLLTLVWIMWAWWVLLVAVGGLVMAYVLAIGAAGGYGELIKSSFDVYHRVLFQRAGLMKDGEGFVPYQTGRSLTMFIRRGIRPKAENESLSGRTG